MISSSSKETLLIKMNTSILLLKAWQRSYLRRLISVITAWTPPRCFWLIRKTNLLLSSIQCSNGWSHQRRCKRANKRRSKRSLTRTWKTWWNPSMRKKQSLRTYLELSSYPLGRCLQRINHREHQRRNKRERRRLVMLMMIMKIKRRKKRKKRNKKMPKTTCGRSLGRRYRLQWQRIWEKIKVKQLTRKHLE